MAGVADEARSLAEQLHSIATAQFARERAGHTLQPTALVSEAWLRLMRTPGAEYRTEAEFRSLAATVVRNVLVDHARSRGAARRGGAMVRVPAELDEIPQFESPREIEALNEAFERLAAAKPDLARIVELKFFGSLSAAQIAEQMNMTERAVRTAWALARVLLRRLMGAAGDGPDETHNQSA